MLLSGAMHFTSLLVCFVQLARIAALSSFEESCLQTALSAFLLSAAVAPDISWSSLLRSYLVLWLLRSPWSSVFSSFVVY